MLYAKSKEHNWCCGVIEIGEFEEVPKKHQVSDFYYEYEDSAEENGPMPLADMIASHAGFVKSSSFTLNPKPQADAEAYVRANCEILFEHSYRNPNTGRQITLLIYK